MDTAGKSSQSGVSHPSHPEDRLVNKLTFLSFVFHPDTTFRVKLRKLLAINGYQTQWVNLETSYLLREQFLVNQFGLNNSYWSAIQMPLNILLYIEL